MNYILKSEGEKEMKKAVIADVTSLHKNGQLLAHMPKVAYNYMKVLAKKYDAKIAGGPAYVNTFGKNVVPLKYDHPEVSKASFIYRLKVKLHEVINTRDVLGINSDIVIFQSYSRLTPILIGILLWKKKQQKVFLIQYFSAPRIGKIDRILENFLKKLVSKKISGIICTKKDIGEKWGLSYIVVPDYFYINDLITPATDFVYDYGMFGFMGIGKNVELVIDTFANSDKKVLIAGRFSSQERFERCQLKCTDNIKIINRYLSDEEYNCLFSETKMILLPYAKGYNEHTSGVVLDALFNRKPVVCSNVNAFRFVADKHLGIVYSNDELSNAIASNTLTYDQFQKNIELYLREHDTYIRNFLAFLENT